RCSARTRRSTARSSAPPDSRHRDRRRERAGPAGPLRARGYARRRRRGKRKGATMAGKIVHVEFPARDTARAMEFWSSLMGWQFQSMDAPMEYHMFEAEPAGAVYPSQAGERGPVLYYGSDDIDADIARIRGLGGQA